MSETQLTPGWIAQLNMYDRAMPDDEVLEMNMFCEEKGNVVNEGTVTFEGTMETQEAMFECLGCTLSN